MSSATKIEWCDATWNPVTGCTHAGVGCGVDPKGRVMPEAIGKTREAAWWALVWNLATEVQNPKQAMAEGFTVRRFRLEEVKCL